MAGLDEGTPLFTQLADRRAAEIADGGLAEGERVPSTNELAAFYRINPATAAKGINVLADEGLLEKRRGIGMFGAGEAGERLPAPGRIHAAVRRSVAVRGGPPRDRHRRAVRPDQGRRPRAGRCLAMTPAI